MASKTKHNRIPSVIDSESNDDNYEHVANRDVDVSKYDDSGSSKKESFSSSSKSENSTKVLNQQTRIRPTHNIQSESLSMIPSTPPLRPPITTGATNAAFQDNQRRIRDESPRAATTSTSSITIAILLSSGRCQDAATLSRTACNYECIQPQQLHLIS